MEVILGETDYTDELVAGCELLWGEGFLSPGGEEEVALIVNGLGLEGKAVLDIGSGIGGPAICLASKHGAGRIVGIDLEPLNVERAIGRSTKARSTSYSVRTPSSRRQTRLTSCVRRTGFFVREDGLH